MLDVVLDEGRDKVIAVVVALVDPEREPHAGLLASSLKVRREELIRVKVVGGALINEQIQLWPGVPLDELRRVVGLPRLLVVVTEVA